MQERSIYICMNLYMAFKIGHAIWTFSFSKVVFLYWNLLGADAVYIYICFEVIFLPCGKNLGVWFLRKCFAEMSSRAIWITPSIRNQQQYINKIYVSECLDKCQVNDQKQELLAKPL